MNGEQTLRRRLGMVVAGSLEQGVAVKLDPSASVEDIKLGTFVTIDGQRRRFFGIITDMALESTDSRLKATPPDIANPLIAQAVSGTVAYATLQVRPMLTIGGDVESILEGPQPAKSIPTHFAGVYQASPEDVASVFGGEDDRHIWIGSPLDMEETRVCLDLGEFVKRSNGVFGKSGTGKSFLTRILLAGILQKDVAVNLVFDMHSEYGWQGTSEDGHMVKGLKQLFGSRVAVFSLDEESSRRRGLTPDFLVRIGYQEIQPEDIETLAGVLNLTENARQATYRLQRELGPGWLSRFLKLDQEAFMELVDRLGEHEATLASLRRRLERLERLPFLVERAPEESVGRILEYLDRGIHVVLEFGRHGNDLAAYILVANLLTRRIHERYVQRTEEAMGERAKEPRPLVITIEEAHRFLNPGVAQHTIFSTIAREMRKYGVTLLVVDQRPSGIDEEVLSQVGTKVTCLLDNDRDVDAVLTGAPGARELKQVLAKLESKQQALIFGHAVPMPVVVRTREYGSAESYREWGFREQAELAREMERDAQDLFG